MRLTPLALLVAACGAPPEAGEAEDCPTDAAPAMEIGVGSESWQSIGDASGEATLVHGPQGGYHLELGLRAEGLDVTDLASAVLRGAIDGEELAVSNTWVQFRCNPATNTADAWNVRLIYASTPDLLDGRETDITATVSDVAGTVFEATASLTIVDPLVR